MINGEEKQYQIGDILSLNCTSGKSSPRSTLTWYINDELVSIFEAFEIELNINQAQFDLLLTNERELSMRIFGA